ncbi:BhlA/UviB family holin-like peptide [Brevibacillus brevis]|uniref:BhlA/UviB family holin-like peptide n=1 Tax=Brevibacillus brevis TaxID=1393 RepID=UPI00165D39BC|nr:BhlA/UviB family holin-like peptide [Brevibacillus brevis]
MEIDVLKYFLTQGPFAVLFVWLLISTKRESRDRETRLNELLEKFSEKYDLVIGEIREIKEKLR